MKVFALADYGVVRLPGAEILMQSDLLGEILLLGEAWSARSSTPVRRSYSGQLHGAAKLAGVGQLTARNKRARMAISKPQIKYQTGRRVIHQLPAPLTLTARFGAGNLLLQDWLK